MSGNGFLLEVKDLKTHFPIRRGFLGGSSGLVKAVDGVSFELREGETLGIVGESGSGKTTLALSILRLIEPTSGSVLFEGADLARLGPRELRKLRRRMQFVFQDPYGSLNPRMAAGAIILEGLSVHGIGRTRAERLARVKEAMESVGLDPESMRRYPHEFSGGQRQRIGIARALALEPRLVVWDEPVSALDVSIQSQVLNLIADLKARYGLTCLFIAHDLSVVEHLSDRVGVMYLGKIVELGGVEEVFGNPLHPYTKALLSAVPAVDRRQRKVRTALSGEPPSPLDPPPGCPFHPRCPLAMDICRREEPRERAAGGRRVSCHAVE